MKSCTKTHPKNKNNEPLVHSISVQTNPQNPLPKHESDLIARLEFWTSQNLNRHEKAAIPKSHKELVSFIEQIFASLKKEEEDTWLRLSNMHLLTPSMIQLCQKKFFQAQTMDWIQLLCYKVVACPDGKSCSSFREQKLLHNQFYDFELECPFYHDAKDQRRISLPDKPQEEFMYKGKYQERILEENFYSAYSQNYFESVFHPLFYKFFDCKRSYCKSSIYCPMKHSKEEQIAWEEEFSLNWLKERSTYYPRNRKNFQHDCLYALEQSSEAKTQRKNFQKQKHAKEVNKNQRRAQNLANNLKKENKENFVEIHNLIDKGNVYFDALEGENESTDANNHKKRNDSQLDDTLEGCFNKLFNERSRNSAFDVHSVLSALCLDDNNNIINTTDKNIEQNGDRKSQDFC